MKLTVELDFWLDGIDEMSKDDIEKSLIAVFESGTEATCTDITVIHVKES